MAFPLDWGMLRRYRSSRSSRLAPLIIAHKRFDAPLVRRQSSFPPPSRRTCCLLTDRACHGVRLQVLQRLTRLSVTVSPTTSCVPTPPEGHQNRARKIGSPNEHHPHTTGPSPPANRPAEPRGQSCGALHPPEMRRSCPKTRFRRETAKQYRFEV
jgi:hypothetical protein